MTASQCRRTVARESDFDIDAKTSVREPLGSRTADPQ